MRLPSRIVAALIALTLCVWAGATLVRHFAGTPDRGLSWLFLAPAVGCLLTLAGLAVEYEEAVWRRSPELPSWRAVHPLGLGLQYAGLALLGWRAVWMFFSWDGMFFFPAWLCLALALYRWHPRWVPEA